MVLINLYGLERFARTRKEITEGTTILIPLLSGSLTLVYLYLTKAFELMGIGVFKQLHALVKSTDKQVEGGIKKIRLSTRSISYILIRLSPANSQN